MYDVMSSIQESTWSKTKTEGVILLYTVACTSCKIYIGGLELIQCITFGRTNGWFSQQRK